MRMVARACQENPPRYLGGYYFSDMLFLRRYERVTRSIGVAHRPQIERPGRTAIFEKTHAAVHERKIGSARPSTFVDDGMATMLDAIRIVTALAFQHIHEIVRCAQRIGRRCLGKVFLLPKHHGI